MSAQLTGRIGGAAEWLLLIVCTMLFAGNTLPKAWRTLNTDFPNYYLTAQLARQGYDMTQAYDWRWLQREKDHRGIDQRVIGLAPITPFSTLFVWPLASLPPLTAKHLWMLIQLVLLVPIGLGLREITGLPLRRIALIATACFPLHRNLLYGQFYILLLAMLVGACWAYRRQLFVVSGSLVALAAMTKIFPAVFLLYFLRKRSWRALSGAAFMLALCSSLSVAVFGWGMHRYYLQEVLPWTLRGETLPPYLLVSSSISTLLHRLFVYEPQWNPKPWLRAPIAAAVLAPLLQGLLIAPALLLIRPRPAVGSSPDTIEVQRRLVAIEWSALLCVTLAISTIPASYNFTLLLLPMTVLCSEFVPHRPRLVLLAALLYLGISYPAWNTRNADGLRAMAHEPRLFLIIGFSILCCWALACAFDHAPALDRETARWFIAFIIFVGFGIFTAVRHQKDLYTDYAYRLPTPPDVFLSADPVDSGRGVESIGLTLGGYRLMGRSSGPATVGQTDQLSFASTSAGVWTEDVGLSSQIHAPDHAANVTLTDVRAPKLAANGHMIAAIRDLHGRGNLVSTEGVLLTPARWNVFDAAALADSSFLIAASKGQEMPEIFHVGGHDQSPQPLRLGAARYPAPSSDGRWLAYSRYDSGSWNLWLLDQSTHAAHRITEGNCNHVEPAWERDSKTLLYASDCGRALGFTALCRRRVVP